MVSRGGEEKSCLVELNPHALHQLWKSATLTGLLFDSNLDYTSFSSCNTVYGNGLSSLLKKQFHFKLLFCFTASSSLYIPTFYLVANHTSEVSHNLDCTSFSACHTSGDIIPVLVIFLVLSLVLNLVFFNYETQSHISCDEEVHFIRAYIKRLNSMNSRQ